MASGIGAKLFLDGEKEFRNALSGINNTLRMTKSELGVVSSAFGKNNQSIEAYTAKNNSAKKILSELSEKLKVQEQVLSLTRDKYGEVDDRTVAWQTSVNKTKIEINKLTDEVKTNETAIGHLEKGLDANGNKIKKVESNTDDLSDSYEDASKSANQLDKSVNGMNGSFVSSTKNILVAIGAVEAAKKVLGMVKDSISGAMKRLDTMDQFSRVMTTLTGDSNKAAQALNEVKDSVTGTAYGMDVAAKSTQKLVTSGVDIKKATKEVAIWGDAVAFYSDGTNDSFDSVTDAISKMVSKGKVEMDQLNRMTDAGIPIMQIYADAVGTTVGEAQKGLSSGKISTVDFIDTVEEAFRKGTTSFASIEGAAKQAGASWTGTFDNMKAAITRGTASFIETLDKSMRDAGFGGMKENISSFGKTVENTIKQAASHLPKAMQLVKDCVPLIKGIGAAWVSIQLVKGVQSATQSVGSFKSALDFALQSTKDGGWKAFGSALTSAGEQGGFAGSALSGLGGIMSNLPLVGVAAGVAALATGFVMLKNHVDEQPGSYKRLNTALKEHQEQMDQISATKTKAISENTSELEYYDRLRTELSLLVDENGRVKEGYESRVQFITSTLNEALGMELEMVDGVVQGYAEANESMTLHIERLKAQEVVQAQADALKEQTKVYEEAKKTYAEAQEGILKYEEQISNRRIELINKGKTEEQIANDEIILSGQMNLAIKKAQSDKVEKILNDNLENRSQHEAAMLLLEDGSIESLKKINAMEIKEYDSQGNLIEKSLEDRKKAIETELKRLNDVYEKSTDEGFKSQVAIEIANNEEKLRVIQENIAQQTSVVKNSKEDNENAWKEFSSAGVSGALSEKENFNQVGQLLIQNLADGVDSAEQYGVDSVSKVGDSLVMTIGGKDYLFDAQGNYLGQKLAEATATGIDNNANKVATSAGNTADYARATFGSRDFASSGMNFALEVARGFKENKGSVTGEVDSAASSSQATFSNRDWYSLGANAMIGVENGASGNSYRATNAFSGMATGVVNTIKRIWDQHSPSRLFEKMSKYNIDGAVIGVEENEESLIEAYGNSAVKASKEYENTLISDISNINTAAILAGEVKTNQSIKVNQRVKTDISTQIDKMAEIQSLQIQSLGSEISRSLNGAKVMMDKREMGKLIVEVK